MTTERVIFLRFGPLHANTFTVALDQHGREPDSLVEPDGSGERTVYRRTAHHTAEGRRIYNHVNAAPYPRWITLGWVGPTWCTVESDLCDDCGKFHVALCGNRHKIVSTFSSNDIAAKLHIELLNATADRIGAATYPRIRPSGMKL